MRTSKKRLVRPQAKSLRKRFLYADVTDPEHEEIQAYCRSRQLSVSQFMADLLLKDAAGSRGRRKPKVVVRPEIQLTPQQKDKLELLARLNQKKSIGEYILDVLEPLLELQRLHAPAKTRMLRYYLSDEEHATLSDYLAETGLSPGNYAAMLALRTIRQDTKKRGK